MIFILLLCLICRATSSTVERKELFNIVDYQNRYPLYCQNHLENCRGNGNCLLDRCICRPGWTGEKCDIPSADAVDSCNYLTCTNRTVCSVGESRCDLQINCNESPNDSCHYHPDYGVIYVPFSRWAIAQLAEVKLWVTVEQSDDRNDEHLGHFDYYLPLHSLYSNSSANHSVINLGHVLEIASGPYTQVKTILESIPGSTVKSLTLLEPNLMEYKHSAPGCTYKDGYLNGHRVNFLVGRAEDFLLAEAYDLVVMINGIEHCQDGIQVLHNLYHAVKPGGILVWHERTFDDYRGVPFVAEEGLLDFVFHPLRLKTKFWEWFLMSHFETIYYQKTTDPLNENQHLPYFIARKPEYDLGWKFLMT
jgi:SAM-dependent methyltransferase